MVLDMLLRSGFSFSCAGLVLKVVILVKHTSEAYDRGVMLVKFTVVSKECPTEDPLSAMTVSTRETMSRSEGDQGDW
jgi:hypothetical protein